MDIRICKFTCVCETYNNNNNNVYLFGSACRFVQVCVGFLPWHYSVLFSHSLFSLASFSFSFVSLSRSLCLSCHWLVFWLDQELLCLTTWGNVTTRVWGRRVWGEGRHLDRDYFDLIYAAVCGWLLLRDLKLHCHSYILKQNSSVRSYHPVAHSRSYIFYRVYLQISGF